MNDLNTKEVSDLCVSCGMCCDGTLFGYAQIIEESDILRAKNLNMEVYFENDKPKIKLPCPNFNGSSSF